MHTSLAAVDATSFIYWHSIYEAQNDGWFCVCVRVCVCAHTLDQLFSISLRAIFDKDSVWIHSSQMKWEIMSFWVPSCFAAFTSSIAPRRCRSCNTRIPPSTLTQNRRSKSAVIRFNDTLFGVECGLLSDMIAVEGNKVPQFVRTLCCPSKKHRKGLIGLRKEAQKLTRLTLPLLSRKYSTTQNFDAQISSVKEKLLRCWLKEQWVWIARTLSIWTAAKTEKYLTHTWTRRMKSSSLAKSYVVL